MARYDEFYRGAQRDHDSGSNNGRPECNVSASATSADGGTVNAYCDYDFTEIHYHIHFPENMDPESLIEVLKFMKGDKMLPETQGEEITELDNGVKIQKKTFWERVRNR